MGFFVFQIFSVEWFSRRDVGGGGGIDALRRSCVEKEKFEKKS